MFTKSVDNLFLFFSYKHLTSFLNNKFSSDLKSKKGLVQKLRKFHYKILSDAKNITLLYFHTYLRSGGY